MFNAVAPLIAGSSNFDTNYSNYIVTQTLISLSITDGTAVLSNGMLTGLSGPFIEDTEAVNISYIRASEAAGNIYDIQYNDQGFFGGSPNLLFNTDTLQINGTLTDGILICDPSIQAIYNVNDPVSNLQVATKQYVDNYYNINLYTYDSVNYSSGTTGTTYTNVINSYISRSLSSDSTDTIPLGTDIYNELLTLFPSGPIINNYYKCLIQNNSPYFLTVDANTSQFINSTTSTNQNFLIGPYYSLFLNILYTGSTTTFSLIPLYNGLGTTYIQNFTNIPNNSTNSYFTTQYPYNVENILLFPINPNTYTSTTYSYTLNDINNTITIRNPLGGNATDYFGPILTNQTNNFIIQNISTNTITVLSTNGWLFDNNYSTSFIIQPSTSSYFLISYYFGSWILNSILQ